MKTEELIERIEQDHDWSWGRPWGGPGTRVTWSDTCRRCGMVRARCYDRQNGIDTDLFWLPGEGTPMTLERTADIGCHSR